MTPTDSGACRSKRHGPKADVKPKAPAKERDSESRVRENRLHGLMRGGIQTVIGARAFQSVESRLLYSDDFKLEVPLDTAVGNAERVLADGRAEPGDCLSAVLILAKAKLKGELKAAWWQLKDPIARTVSISLLEGNAQLLENAIRERLDYCDRFKEPEARQRRQELELLLIHAKTIRKAAYTQMKLSE